MANQASSCSARQIIRLVTDVWSEMRLRIGSAAHIRPSRRLPNERSALAAERERSTPQSSVSVTTSRPRTSASACPYAASSTYRPDVLARRMRRKNVLELRSSAEAYCCTISKDEASSRRGGCHR